MFSLRARIYGMTAKPLCFMGCHDWMEDAPVCWDCNADREFEPEIMRWRIAAVLGWLMAGALGVAVWWGW